MKAWCLKNRALVGRGFLVNALAAMGPATRELATIGLEDLEADSDQLRQQGVIILSVSAKFSESALTGLIKAADDESSLMRRTAIRSLIRMRESSQRANDRIQEIATDSQRREDSGYIQSVLRFEQQTWLGEKMLRGFE